MKPGPPNSRARAPRRPALASETPEALALRAQQGSLEAFSRLVELFQDRLYNFLLRRASAHDAEDLAQETFIRAWQRIALYKPTWRFSTWLFTIAVRQAAARARRAGGGRWRSLDGLTEGPAAAGRDPTPDDASQGRRLWALVDEVLGPEPRAAVWLRYAEDLSMQEIALVMGKSEVGVRVMLHRARAQLAQRWKEVQEPAPAAHARGVSAGAAP